jgi:bla regulator protein BlaR1
MRYGRNLLLCSAACAAIAALAAQSANTDDWQAAAGGKKEFEVASVKPTKTWGFPHFPLDNANGKPAGGRFSATSTLWSYVAFAYKLTASRQQERAVLAQLPKWFDTDIFEIEARAAGNPTKDQVRLMMQSLLAERFKLAVHFESPVMPVFALTLVKPGKMGPKLRPHAEGPPCGEFPSMDAVPTPDQIAQIAHASIFPGSCGTQESRRGPTGAQQIGSRDASMATVADTIYSYGVMAGEVDKPVVDQTGLQGSYDFSVEYGSAGDSFARPASATPAAGSQEAQGISFLTALREQLGLKLVSTKAPVQMIVIDHIEKPSQN